MRHEPLGSVVEAEPNAIAVRVLVVLCLLVDESLTFLNLLLGVISQEPPLWASSQRRRSLQARYVFPSPFHHL